MSDGTQLTTYTGDKKAWPIYLTIGNISQAFRGKPSNHATVLLAFLLIPPKVGKVGATIKRQIQKNTHRIIQIILGHILLSIQVEENNPLIALCGDGKARSCHLCIAGWCADYPKHITLQCLQSGVCQWCEIDKNLLGDSPINAKIQPRLRDHIIYQRLWLKGKFDELLSCEVCLIQNALWSISATGHEFPKQDILHTIWLGMIKHLIEWLVSFLEKHSRMSVFNQIWLSVSSFYDMTAPNKTYSDVTQ